MLEQKQDTIFRQVLNETYFGRTPGINRVFNAFCDFRDKYKNNRLIGKSDMSAQSDPLLKTFVREIEREFGFYSVSIILNNSDSTNMMTSIPVFGVGPNKVEITKTGYRYKKDAKVSTIFIVIPGLLFNAEYSNEECFAVFLHEIGHNFQNSLNSTLIGLNWATNLIYIFNAIEAGLKGDIEKLMFQIASIGTSTNIFNTEVSKAFNKIVVDNDAVAKMYSFFSFLYNTCSDIRSQFRIIKNIVQIPFALIIGGLESLIKLAFNPIGSYYGYMGERFADGFPPSYGFGAEKASALMKMDKTSSYFGFIGKVIDSVPVVGHVYNAMLIPGLMITTFGDVHPETYARLYSILNDLKADLNDPNLDPKLKKQLEEEIARYEKAIEQNFAEAKRINNPELARVWFSEFMYYHAKGGLKYRLFDVENKFRITTNATVSDIKQGKYDIISKTKIK